MTDRLQFAAAKRVTMRHDGLEWGTDQRRGTSSASDGITMPFPLRETGVQPLVLVRARIDAYS